MKNTRREFLGMTAAAAAGLAAGCATKSEERPVATSQKSTRLPTLYIPHGGGPCFFMEWTMGPPDTWDAMKSWLGELGRRHGRPEALLVVSAHWEEPVVTVQSGARPPLLYDYYGFPPETYQLTWPAPGAPRVAERVRGLLAAAGIESRSDEERGFDHGVFVPLKVAYPDADIPTAQLSLQAGLDPARHIAIGRALAPLRDEGVLILGSGMSFHNMRAFHRPDTIAASRQFDAWLGEVCEGDPAARDQALARWSDGPSARFSHPREEHLLPLMVAAGAAEGERGRRIFQDEVMGARVSAFELGEPAS
jgi:aromatic ring-opening dioxygenase catalytic subunit (LigB family)